MSAHDCYAYAYRAGSWAWKCSCGAESKRRNHKTKQDAIDDWAKHKEGAT